MEGTWADVQRKSITLGYCILVLLNNANPSNLKWASIELLSNRSVGLKVKRANTIKTDEKLRLVNPASGKDKLRSFVDIDNARLKVEGSIISCRLGHRHEVEEDIYPTHFISFRGKSEFMYMDLPCDANLDTQEASANVLCLLIAATTTQQQMSWTWPDYLWGEYIVQHVLVLQSDESGIYTRVGLSEIDSRKGWFDDAEVAAVEII